MFDQELGAHIPELFPDAVALSSSAVAAPGFVSAAIDGETGTPLPARRPAPDVAPVRRPAAGVRRASRSPGSDADRIGRAAAGRRPDRARPHPHRCRRDRTTTTTPPRPRRRQAPRGLGARVAGRRRGRPRPAGVARAPVRPVRRDPGRARGRLGDLLLRRGRTRPARRGLVRDHAPDRRRDPDEHRSRRPRTPRCGSTRSS